ncbi:MAG: DUF4124 domain-containing protein [Rubrivivax sp.]
MLPRRNLSVLAAALLLGLLSAPAAAQWKWRDAAGRVTMSDLPPPHTVPEKDILQRPRGARAPVPVLVVADPAASAPAAEASAPAFPGSAVRSGTDPALEARRKQTELDKQRKEKAEADKLAAQRADNCRRAQSHLATLDSGIRLQRVNGKGEREILNDAQRADETRRTRDIIASDCR